MKQFLIVAGIVLAILFTGLALLVALGFFWTMSASPVAVSESDRQVVVRAQDLVPYIEEYAPVDEFESFTKVEYLDHAIELNYEYSSPREDEPFIAVTVTNDVSMTDANMTYATEWSGQQLGLNITDRDFNLVEAEGVYEFGDRSRFGNIEYKGETVGHIFVTQFGMTTYAFTITGLWIDDAEIWQELFDERLERLSNR